MLGDKEKQYNDGHREPPTHHSLQRNSEEEKGDR
jgi:hypothetical protein